MATTARLTALVSVMLAAGMALAVPSGQASGIVALVGWAGVGLLVIGLTFGIPGAITAAAVAFVIRLAIAAMLPAALPMPLWATVLLIVLMIEFGTASFTFRTRPVDPVHIIGRALAAGLGAVCITQSLAILTGAADATGVLVRIVGIGALVVATGWVTWTWRRSGITG